SAGVANASPDMTGKTYAEAAVALKQDGLTAVARSTVGDKTAQGIAASSTNRTCPRGFRRRGRPRRQ
ncbi:MAG: hypothetical protein JWL98_638, partial [Xanthomonadaceae bacterium]|nr:hypothetical protein [Xanthomonadaceae bacterium]